MNPSRVLTREMDEAARACAEGHRVSTRTFSHLRTWERDASVASPDDLRLLLDCAQVCSVAADFLLRASEFHVLMCSLCAEICRKCQQNCRQLAAAEGDPVLAECAAACLQCSNACRRVMAASAAA
jgi:hypothetical protein